jgi:hypothetical protein
MNNTSPPKSNLTRLDRWKEPQYGALLISPPPAPDGKLAQAIDEHWAKIKEKDPEQPNWSISDYLQSAKELIFDIIDGKPVFHVVLFCLDPERFELCITSVFDMIDLTPDEVRITLVRALARNVPVYPNTKDLEESLVRFHKDLIEDGFNLKDSSGKETRFKLVKPLTKVLENLNPIEVPSPAELCLMREALQNEISQRDHAGRILANLKIAIDELENSLTGKKRNENQIQRTLTRNPILFGVEYCPALIFRPCLPRHGQTPARRLRVAGKRTALARRTRLRRPRPAVERWRSCASSRRLNLRTGPSSPSAARGFVVRDLPWTVEKLRVIPPFEFENWAVIALGGTHFRGHASHFNPCHHPAGHIRG